MESKKDIVRYIQNGGDVNKINNYGHTYLKIFAMEGDVNMIYFLLNNNVNINYQDYDKNTVIMTVAKHIKMKTSFLKIFSILLKKGADINIRNNKNENLICHAYYCFSDEIFNFLLKKTDNIKNRNYLDGSNILTYAINNNNIKRIFLILKHKSYRFKMMKLKKLNLNTDRLLSKRILINL